MGAERVELFLRKTGDTVGVLENEKIADSSKGSSSPTVH